MVLTVIGGVLLMSGAIMALVGEAMRLKPKGELRGLVSAGGVTAALGLLCGLAAIAVAVGAAGRRRWDLRAVPRVRAAWDHETAAAEWVSPFRLGHAGQYRPVRARFPAEPQPSSQASPQPPYLAPGQPGYPASALPPQPGYPEPWPDQAGRQGSGHQDQFEPGYQTAYPASAELGQQAGDLPGYPAFWPPAGPAEPRPAQLAAFLPAEQARAGETEDTSPLPVVGWPGQPVPGERGQPVPGGPGGQGSEPQDPLVRGPFEPFDRSAVSRAVAAAEARAEALPPAHPAHPAVPAAGAGPASASALAKLDQIRDLYLTAEAIGDDALGRHFDELSLRQRQLISEYFAQAGLGRDGWRRAAGR